MRAPFYTAAATALAILGLQEQLSKRDGPTWTGGGGGGRGTANTGGARSAGVGSRSYIMA